MSVVKSIGYCCPSAIYLAGSSVKGQGSNLNSTLVNPIVKVELVGRVTWMKEETGAPAITAEMYLQQQGDYVHKTKTFPVKDNWLSAGSHIFDFHFNLPPRLPSTFSSRTGHVSYFIQASCMGREHVLAKRRMYLLVQGTSDGHQESPAQVATGAECGQAGPRRQGGRGRAGGGQGTQKATCWGLPRPPYRGIRRQGRGCHALGDVWGHRWLSHCGGSSCMSGWVGTRDAAQAPTAPRTAPCKEQSGPECP
uniref:Arrestin-like N-terminal domain-containing protein n=1 Tax=Equus caballus TaxID=9796 RepID=A0A3Q2KYK0_HORSE